MSIDDSSSPERPADLRSTHIHAARAQVVAARLRQQRHGASGSPLPSSDPVIPGKGPPGYTLLRELQRGGQGVVYVAIQESTARQVAIKQMHVGPPSAAAAMRLARFEREIEILSRLKHPNIVTIHDCGRHDNHVYLVMDYVNGRPVDACVDPDRTPLSESLNLFARICDGVNAAHLRGVIHRDLKPGNILVDERGQPHVLDFGLAKLADDSIELAPSQAMTATGQFIGSLPWASPEQAEGRAELLDIRSDVYSLGVILYQLLTGRFPYPLTGRLDDVVRQIVNTNPVRPSVIRRNIDRELDTIMLKCLAKEPERRYQNAGELARDIRRYLAGQAIDARGDSTWYIICKQLQKHRAMLLAGCAFVALLIASSVTAWLLYAAAVRARDAEHAFLWESLVAQARAGRNGDRVGRRIDSLNAIRRARDFRFERELRDEAVACLALTDLRCIAEFKDIKYASVRGLGSVDRFAGVAKNGRVEVRDIASNSLMASLDVGDSRVFSMTFSHDGGMLAAKAIRQRLGVVWVWEVASHRQIMHLDCPWNINSNLSFSPDGRQIGIVHSEKSATLFDLPSTRSVVEVSADFKIGEISFDPAGRRLALIADNAPLVALWDRTDSRVVRTLHIPAVPFATEWAPDGKTLAVGALDYNVYLYDLDAQAPPRVLKGHRGPVVALQFNSTGDRLSSGSWDRQVRIWDLSTGSGLKETLVGCSLVGGSDRLALLRNDRLQIWQFEEVSVVRAIRAGEGDGARCGCFVPGRHTVAAGGPNGVWLFDVFRPNSPIQLDTGDARRPIASPDGRHIYSLVNHQIVDWTLLDGHDATEVASRRIIPIAERPTDIALSKDLQRLVVCSGSEVLVHDPATGLLLRRAEIGRGIESPALTTDGRRALIGNWKGPQNTACLLDLETMKVVRRFPGESVTGVFSSDNRRLAVCTPKQIEVWDIATDALRWSIPREPGQDLAVRSAFSPDGRKLAISASLYDIHLVDAETGQLIVRLPNPSLYMIGDLEFSSDGRLLLAATSSSIVYVWDLDAMQRELQALRLGW